jgi:flagellar hook-associated protein 2
MALNLPGISSTGTLNAPGVGSGLDIKGLVSQLMAVEQKPLTQLALQEAKYQAKLSSLGSIKGALASLQSAAQALATASTASYSAAVSDSSVLSATAASGAVAGTYSVSVDGSKLAQGQKLVAPGRASLSASIGAGASTTLTITLGTITGGPPVAGQYANADFTADPARTPVSLTIDSSNNTLAGIRDAINAANAGVSASIINDGSGLPYRLTLTSNDTGAASSMKLSVSGDAALGALLDYDPHAAPQTFNETQSAQNAQFTVDGVAITSATNTVSDAIPGVTLTLANKPGINSASVTLNRTGGSLTAALGGLVNAYNAANAAIASATAKGAVMQGEGGVLGLQRQMRAILGGTQLTGGAYTTLSQLGIGFQADGSLKLDSLKLNAALSANIGDVSSLAAAIGNALKSAADGLLGSAGPITSKTESLNRSIADIGSRRARLQDRLEAVQARYQKQFSALDTMVSSMNSTSAYLTQQLANLPGSTTK